MRVRHLGDFEIPESLYIASLVTLGPIIIRPSMTCPKSSRKFVAEHGLKGRLICIFWGQFSKPGNSPLIQTPENGLMLRTPPERPRVKYPRGGLRFSQEMSAWFSCLFHYCFTSTRGRSTPSHHPRFTVRCVRVLKKLGTRSWVSLLVVWRHQLRGRTESSGRKQVSSLGHEWSFSKTQRRRRYSLPGCRS